MHRSLRNLAILLAVMLSRAIWVAECQAKALGFVVIRPFIDFLKETTVFFIKKWAGWMEKDGNILIIEVSPVISPPFGLDIRPP